MASFYYWWVPVMASASDGSVPGEVVVAIIGAIFTGLGVLAGKKLEKAATASDVTIKNQPVGVVKHQQPVTWADHINLVRRVDRIDSHLDAMRKESSDQFKDLLEAASSRENRIIDKIDDVARAIHARIDNWKGGAK